MKRTTIFWALSLVLVVIAIAGMTEVLSRLLASSPSQLGYLLNHWETERMTGFIDPPTGAAMLKPGLSFTALNRDGQFVGIKTDSLGFRNERDYDQAPIVALGDSMTYGDGVPESERWVSVLGRMAGVEIYCVAAGLTGPAQQVSLLKRTVGTLHQSTTTVLWMITSGNDVGDSYGYVLRQKAKRAEFAKSGGSSFNAFVIWAAQHSYGVRLGLIVVRVGRLRFAHRSSAIRAKVLGGTMEFFPVAETYISSEEFRIGLTELSTAIRDFAGELKSQGRRLVVIYAPSREETYADKLKALGVPPLGIIRFDDVVEELCRRNGIEFLNLRPPFEIEGQSGAVLYFLRDGHWNRRGNQVAADTIYRYLSSHPERSVRPESGK